MTESPLNERPTPVISGTVALELLKVVQSLMAADADGYSIPAWLVDEARDAIALAERELQP